MAKKEKNLLEAAQEKGKQKQAEVSFEDISAKAQAEQTGLGAALNKYRNLIGAALVGVVAVVAGIYFYGEYKASKQVEAQEAAMATFRFFEQDSMNAALTGDLNRPALSKLADDYSGTATGNIATYMAGVAHLRKGEYDQAISFLKDFKKGDDMLTVSAYAALASAYEAKKNFEDAAKNYKRAANTLANSQTTPALLANAARCFERAGDKKEALSIYKEIKKAYPLSQEGRSADKYIAYFSAQQ